MNKEKEERKTKEEKKQDLFLSQKELLDTFLSHGAISKEQYDISLNGLIKKMHIKK